MTERLDIDQKRASYAFDMVESVGDLSDEAKQKLDEKQQQKKTEELKKKYGSQIESLPMMIHTSGLRNTLAFAYAKGYLKDAKEWRQVFTHLINWFAEEDPTKFFRLKEALSENGIGAKTTVGYGYMS